MKNEVITASKNPKIKELKELTAKSSKRREAGLFVCDGVRLCRDAALSKMEIVSVFVTEYCRDKNIDDFEVITENAENVYLVSDEVMKSASDTVTPQGIICTVRIKNSTFTPQKGKKYIALDAVQNPNNLGAVIRTAEAVGVDGLVISGGCDIYNPKALRSSMGSIFRMPVTVTSNLENEIEEYKKLGIHTFASVVSGKATDITKADFTQGGICVIGNEGNGVSLEVQNACDEKVTIVMKGRAESLNAAEASSIIMWEMTK